MTTSYGLSLVFCNVLLEQLGVPVPALPTLIVAGALVADRQLPGTALCAVALLACVLGDSAWYLAGRAYGGGVMKLLCRLSLTPDICVSETQTTFERWGAKALIVAKFVPGLSMVAPPLSGALRMGFARFTAFSALGSLLWIGAALLAGALLRAQIEQVLPRLLRVGGASLVLLAVLLVCYVAFRWWQRRRFHAALEMARISVQELHRQMAGEPVPLIVDVRSSTARSLELRGIPGAMHLPVQEVPQQLGKLPRDRDIILYCTCPNEASAAQAARVLMTHGFKRVRPLHGGLDAWIAAGYAVETVAAGVAAPAPLAAGAAP